VAKLPGHIKVARAALRKAIALKVWKAEGVTLRAKWFKLVDMGEDSQSSGFAGYLGGTIKVGGESTDAFIQQLTVHELAHTCLYRLSRQRGKRSLEDSHGPRFQGLMRAASCEFFGLTDAELLPLWDESKEAYRGGSHKHAYQLDWVIAKLVNERTGGSARDKERKERARARGRAEVERQELKRGATKIADAEGWGRAYSAYTGARNLVIHAHRYIGSDDEEFACGYRFDEYGPSSGWNFTKPDHKTSFRVTCLKCVHAILKTEAAA
jgi:hypothetical protein